MTFPDHGRHPLAAVAAGMPVVDSAGERIGAVEYVTMGDPEAVTVQGPENPPDTLADDVAEAIAAPEPDLPPSVAARLQRVGFFKVDSGTEIGGNEIGGNAGGGLQIGRYVAADEIADVTDEGVLLKVPGERLARQS